MTPDTSFSELMVFPEAARQHGRFEHGAASRPTDGGKVSLGPDVRLPVHDFLFISEHPGLAELEFVYNAPAVLPPGQRWSPAQIARWSESKVAGRSLLARAQAFLRGLARGAAPESETRSSGCT